MYEQRALPVIVFECMCALCLNLCSSDVRAKRVALLVIVFEYVRFAFNFVHDMFAQCMCNARSL